MPYEGHSNQGHPAGGQPDITVGAFTLRRWQPADATQLVTAFQDSAIRKWNRRTLDSVQEAEALINAWKRGWRRDIAASWAVARTNERATVLGQAGFRSLFIEEGLAEVSYWVMPHERGRGLATLAADALANWGMKHLALERLELVHSVENLASCRVALQAGYQWEGVKRRLQQHADGRRHDMCPARSHPRGDDASSRTDVDAAAHPHCRTPRAVRPERRRRRPLRRPPGRRLTLTITSTDPASPAGRRCRPHRLEVLSELTVLQDCDEAPKSSSPPSPPAPAEGGPEASCASSDRPVTSGAPARRPPPDRPRRPSDCPPRSRWRGWPRQSPATAGT